MHDDVRPRGDHGFAQRGGVERVDDHRLGAERVQPAGVRAGRPGDVVSALDQLRDEAAAERAGRAGDEDA